MTILLIAAAFAAGWFVGRRTRRTVELVPVTDGVAPRTRAAKKDLRFVTDEGTITVASTREAADFILACRQTGRGFKYYIGDKLVRTSNG